MSADNATDYADQVATGIQEKWDAGTFFGFANQNDGSTVESLEEIDGYDADEHDADNLPENWEKGNAWDYVRDVLDIHYIVNNDRSYRGARLYITLGGPSAYIDTESRELVVSWWSEPVRRSLPSDFCEELDEALEEYWDNSN